MTQKRSAARFIRGMGRIFYHVLLVAMSAGIAFSVPFIIKFVAKNFLNFWAIVENEKIFLISVEIALALLLVLGFNYLARSWKDRRLAKLARGSGIVRFFPTGRFLTLRRIRALKRKQGFARDVMIISSTGFRTFVEPRGDLHNVVQDCREARIMLLNPYSEGAVTRARSILESEVSVGHFREQIKSSIEFLRSLRTIRKNVRLKLYADPPFLKLAILGDYVWVKHYHPGRDIQKMPEFVFEHGQNPGSLYTAFYHGFLTRWDDSDIPEYDFDTDELIFRDANGKELRRDRFPAVHDADSIVGFQQALYPVPSHSSH